MQLDVGTMNCVTRLVLCVEVVGDDMALSLSGFERDHLAQKRDQLFGGEAQHAITELAALKAAPSDAWGSSKLHPSESRPRAA